MLRVWLAATLKRTPCRVSPSLCARTSSLRVVQHPVPSAQPVIYEHSICRQRQEVQKTSQEAVQQALAHKAQAEAKLQEEAGLRERMMALAAGGQLPGQGGDAPATPGWFLSFQGFSC